MKRCWLVVVPVFLAAALAWADGPAPPDDADRARRLHRNLDLITVLVEGGLNLAGEEDPFGRARRCTSLADHLAKEIRQAAEARDTPRVVELGRHLQAMLGRGVASNLSLARNGVPPGSTEEKKIQEVRDSAAYMVEQLEEQLQQVVDAEPQADDRAEIQRALERIQDGRFLVERAFIAGGKSKGKSGQADPPRPPAPAPGKGQGPTKGR